MNKGKIKYIDTFISLVPFIFFIIMAHALNRSHGFLRFNHLCFVTISAVLFFVLYFKREQVKIDKTKALSFIWVLFSIFQVINPGLIYSHNNNLYLLLKFILILNLGLSFLIGYSNFIKPIITIKNNFLKIIFLSISLYFISYVLVIYVTPNPQIDVYSVTSIGADHLLKGFNPYSQNYPDIFNGRYGYVAGYVYWPLVLLPLTISKFIFGDVRFIYIISILITVVLMNKLSNHFKISKEKNSLLILCWLSFPITHFVLEQTWTEFLVIAEVISLTYFLLKKKNILAGISLGLLASTKQYNLFMIIFFLIYAFRTLGIKSFLKIVFSSLLVWFLITAPFFFWDKQAFLDRTILEMLHYKLRVDSFSWVAYFHRFYGFNPTGLFYNSIYLISTILIGGYLSFKKELKLINLYNSLLLIYLIIFLFGKQAFCNYYYLTAFFLVMVLQLLKGYRRTTI